MRILLDPTAETAGVSTVNVSSAPAPETGPPAAVDPHLAELAQLRTWKAQADAAAAQQAEEARRAEQLKLAEKGETEKLIKLHNEQLQAERTKAEQFAERTRTAEKSRALTAALAGKDVIPTAPAQLQKLWADDFETVEGPDGGFVVRCKATLRPADVVVAERLASPDYAHFVKAGSRGGSGASGGSNPAATRDPNAPPLNDLQKSLAPFVVGSGVDGPLAGGFGLRGRVK